MLIYTPSFNSFCSPLPNLLFFATLVSATRNMFEYSWVVDQVDIRGWNAFEASVISQKEDLFYKARLNGFHLWAQIVVCSA